MSGWNCQLEEVSAQWPGREANTLKNISQVLPIDTVSCLPLMGPSGQGKSTLLYLLAALKWPSHGTVRWTFPDGKSCSWDKNGLDSREATELHQKRFGFAFQNSTLFPRFTVEENIAYPLVLTGEKWSVALKEAKKQLSLALIEEERQKIHEFLKSFPNQLSGGQKQRVALAQAMIHKPWVLFADEPTGQLDYCTRKQVMNTLKHWLKEEPNKRRLIWVTHHHTDDLQIMNINQLMFVHRRSCHLMSDNDLKKWMQNCT